MSIFFFTLVFASTLANANEEAIRLKDLDPLECTADPENAQDPYQKMLDEHRKELTRDFPAIRQAGVPWSQRNAFWNELSATIKKVCAARKSQQDLADAYLAKAKAGKPEQGCAIFREIEPEYQAMEAQGQTNATTTGKELETISKSLVQRRLSEFADIKRQQAFDPMRGPFQRVWGAKISNTNQLVQATLAEQNAMVQKGAARPLFPGYLLQIKKEVLDSQRLMTELVTPARTALAGSSTNCAALVVGPLGTQVETKADGHVITMVGSGGQVYDATNGPLQVNDPGLGVANGITPPGSIPPPGTPEKQSWVSENKSNLIVGGVGVAAVGGLLLYKRNADKKAKREEAVALAAWEAEQAANPSSETTTATATATSTSTSTSEESSSQTLGKQLRSKGSPSSAKVNETLTPIVVYLVDDNGQKVNDENVEIRVECTESCSLSGTLTLPTKEGAVEFRDLKFTAAKTGVQFRFSASGSTSITSEGTFTVTE